MRDYRKEWAAKASKLLVGRTIKYVGYLTDSELENMGWAGSALAITLDNDLTLFASQDDEGNGPGALFTTDPKLPTFPVCG